MRYTRALRAAAGGSSNALASAAKQSQFRILALPLARLPRVSSSGSSSSSAPRASPASSSSTDQPKAPTPLLLFHVTQPLPSPTPKTEPDQRDGQPQPNPKPKTKPAVPLYQRALNTASAQWLKLGDKPRDSWMGWFYAKGEGLMDKIEYEEWALKAVQENVGVRVDKDGKVAEGDRVEIPLLRPEIDPALPPLLPKLHRHLIHRIPYHKKMMTRSLIFSPATFPFAIIPVLPNFPLFYVLWRAYSHYKAWRGAQYLEHLLRAGLIVERPSTALTDVYAARAQGVMAADKGAEDRAPDATTSGHSARGIRAAGADTGEVKVKGEEALEGESKGERLNTDDARGLPAQAKGEEGAVDGTATPEGMVYRGKGGAASGQGQGQDRGAAPTDGLPRLNDPALLLTRGQVPLLERAFELRQTERMDVVRAVEQVELRLRTAQKGRGEQETGGDGVAGGKDKEAAVVKDAWKGNLHR